MNKHGNMPLPETNTTVTIGPKKCNLTGNTIQELQISKYEYV